MASSTMYRFISIFFFLSSVVLLFIKLNRVQPHHYIDEIFHIPQTLRYCAGNLTEWDPKITTLPGLYLVTALLLSPLDLCSTVYMRSISLLGTFFNFILVYYIVKEISIHRKQRWNECTKLAVVYNVTLFPPLFFWHFLFYTDVVSVTSVLLVYLLHLKARFYLAASAGFFAVLIRQTNIVWIVFLTVERTLDLLDRRMQKSVSSQSLDRVARLQLLWKVIARQIRGGPISFLKFLIEICVDLLPYVLVCLAFVGFVVYNEGIVVGDRAAHKPILHIPQFLYYSIFVFGFSWPYMIVHLNEYFNFIKKHWILGSCLFALLSIVVHSNTLVHPYVLADNRHYVFYFWNKFMARYALFRYSLIPLYSFTLYAMFRSLSHLRFDTQINYFLITFLVLVPQLLLESRYFLLPYIFFRFNLVQPKRWQIFCESFTTLLVNFLQFFIFMNKTFYWSDQPHPQRISW